MRLVATFFACLLSCYSAAQALTQAQLAEFGADAELRFGTVQNYGDGGIKVSLTLDNKSSVALPKGTGDWTVYLHSVRKITDIEVSGVKINHIQGDLHQLVPTADFAGLAAGKALSLVYSVNASMASFSDYM